MSNAPYGTGRPPINLAAHWLRGEGPAHEFEQMLALLIEVTEGPAHEIRVARGDGGIDVLVGQLNGDIAVFQAKYHRKRLSQKAVDESFQRAMDEAEKNHYRITRWVLCIPTSLTVSEQKWWSEWCYRVQAERAQLRLELWSETQIVERLLRPEAEHIARAFYDPYRASVSPSAPDLSIRPKADEAANPAVLNVGGLVRFGDRSYLIREPIDRLSAPDRSWHWQEATAITQDRASAMVRIRHVTTSPRVLSSTDSEPRPIWPLRSPALVVSRSSSIGRIPPPGSR